MWGSLTCGEFRLPTARVLTSALGSAGRKPARSRNSKLSSVFSNGSRDCRNIVSMRLSRRSFAFAIGQLQQDPSRRSAEGTSM